MKKGKYDEETRTIALFGRKFLRKSVITRYKVDPDHFYYYKKRRNVKPYVIIDIAKRTSVNPERISNLRYQGESKELHSNEPIDEKMKSSLDFLIERSFWQALLMRYKIPLLQILIFMLAGIGIYAVVRMILQAFGVQLP